MASKLPQSFRKLVVTRITQKFREAVELKEFPLPKPGPKEVLIKNRFVGVNASDINVTASRYDPRAKPPFDVGFEGVGEVVAVGENTPLKVGQPVGYMENGAYSEYKIVKAGYVVPLPSVSKAFIPLMVSGTTAAISLDKVGELKKGETVLVTAAAGGTGQFAVQWAKQAGCHVIGTCSSDEKVKFLKSIGCDRPINYKQESLKEVLKKEYPNGLDVVYESIGGEMFTTAVKNLAKRGRLIVIGLITSYENDTKSLASTSAMADLQALPTILLSKSASIRGFFLFDYFKDVAPYCMKMAEMYMAGQLQCHTDQAERSPSGPLRGIEDCVRGVEYLYTGKSHGKVIVELNSPEAKL